MADATLALNPVTPLWNGAQVSTANAFPVQLFTSALSGWTYTNIAVSGGTTVQVKASAGTIHGATVNVVSTGAVITLVDSITTGATTPVIASFSGASVNSFHLRCFVRHRAYRDRGDRRRISHSERNHYL